jgi:hypothetical protein
VFSKIIYMGKFHFPPFMYEYFNSPLFIKLNNVLLHILRLCNLSRTFIFLLYTNKTYTNCLKYPILTHLLQPTQSLNQFKKKNSQSTPEYLTQKMLVSLTCHSYTDSSHCLSPAGPLTASPSSPPILLLPLANHPLRETT